MPDAKVRRVHCPEQCPITEESGHMRWFAWVRTGVSGGYGPYGYDVKELIARERAARMRTRHKTT